MTRAILTEQELAFLNTLTKGPRTIKEIKTVTDMKSIYFIADKLINKELIQKNNEFYSLTEKGRVVVEVL